MKIEIRLGNILDQKVDALVTPANASGYMGYGVAKAIVHAGGRDIEKQAVNQAPLVIGDAIFTTAGTLPFRGIIHTATLDNPNEELKQGNISKAFLGAALLADELECTSIAVSGMGTGQVGISHDVAAQAMRNAVADIKPQHLQKIIFVDLDEGMVDAWERYFGSTRS